MTNLYTATASNLYFYQALAVRAESRGAAYDKFRAYLATEENQSVEAEELENAEQTGVYAKDRPELDRASYIYNVDYQGVELIEDGEIPAYAGEIGDDVVMTASGCNG